MLPTKKSTTQARASKDFGGILVQTSHNAPYLVFEKQDNYKA